MDWKAKLDIFLSDFEHRDDIVGVMACGSYVTGSPSNHSDLDVHLVLDNMVEYRERGNKIVDGLLIEYFANPPRQISRYFEEDLADKSLMSQTQFATGEILLDKTGDVAALKSKALEMMDTFYSNDAPGEMPDITKYFLWDMLDDLQDAFENSKPDFDLLYFTSLDRMISSYTQAIGRPYNVKVILGNITDSVTRRKYLLRELPDAAIAAMITNAITAADRHEKIQAYQALTDVILDNFGGFSIDGFKLKSDVEK